MSHNFRPFSFLLLLVFLVISCEKEVIQSHASDSEGRCFVKRGYNKIPENLTFNKFENDKIVILDHGNDIPGLQARHDSFVYNDNQLIEVHHKTRDFGWNPTGEDWKGIKSIYTYYYEYSNDHISSIVQRFEGPDQFYGTIDSFRYENGKISSIRRYGKESISPTEQGTQNVFKIERMIKYYGQDSIVIEDYGNPTFIPNPDNYDFLGSCKYFDFVEAKNPEYGICIPDLFPSYLFSNLFLKKERYSPFIAHGNLETVYLQGTPNEFGYLEHADEVIEYICF